MVAFPFFPCLSLHPAQICARLLHALDLSQAERVSLADGHHRRYSSPLVLIHQFTTPGFQFKLRSPHRPLAPSLTHEFAIRSVPAGTSSGPRLYPPTDSCFPPSFLSYFHFPRPVSASRASTGAPPVSFNLVEHATPSPFLHYSARGRPKGARPLKGLFVPSICGAA